MGRRGTKPKPIELKVLKGTYRKDRDGDIADAVKTSGLPIKPSGMPADESAIWDEVVPKLVEMGVAKEVDSSELGSMCFWIATENTLRKTIRKMRKHGMTMDYRRLQSSAAEAFKCWDKIAMRYGMTSSDRATLKTETPGDGGVRRRNRA